MFKHFLIILACLIISQNLAAAEIPESFIKLEAGQNYQGVLGENEVVRFYFELEKKSEVLLESKTPKRSNTIYPEATLFHQDGRTITRNWSSGEGRNFKIVRELEPGTYVLRVEDGRGCGSLHGCPEILRDYQIVFEVTESTPF
ncbi:hypothetical protein [Marinospirillum sp.]|uniref:hypothetical protein n=1 Tax=Marinospirillum sp. TaxID=2183934 RepID=UPI00384A63BC